MVETDQKIGWFISQILFENGEDEVEEEEEEEDDEEGEKEEVTVAYGIFSLRSSQTEKKPADRDTTPNEPFIVVVYL